MTSGTSSIGSTNMVNERFEKALLELTHGLPLEIAEKINSRMHQEFTKPRVKELEFLLQERFTPDRVRELMFYPDSDTIRFYTKLLCDPPRGAPEDHPQVQVQIQFLAVFYLTHVKKWNLVSAFIQSGGLHTLSSLFEHKNLFIRSQAIDAFMAITGNTDFDWFQPARTKKELELHMQMIDLGCSFVQKCLGNYKGSFPGGSLRSLQLLAFWLSWSRHLYCKNKVLYVSCGLIEKLHQWSKKDLLMNEVKSNIDTILPVDNVDEAKEVTEDTHKNSAADEERQLAKKLYEDFKRFPIKQQDQKCNSSNIETTEAKDTNITVDCTDAFQKLQKLMNNADDIVIKKTRITETIDEADEEEKKSVTPNDVVVKQTHNKHKNMKTKISTDTIVGTSTPLKANIEDNEHTEMIASLILGRSVPPKQMTNTNQHLPNNENPKETIKTEFNKEIIETEFDKDIDADLLAEATNCKIDVDKNCSTSSAFNVQQKFKNKKDTKKLRKKKKFVLRGFGVFS